MKTVFQKKMIAAVLVLGTAWTAANTQIITVKAEDEAPYVAAEQAQEVQTVVTEYSDLWTGKVTFKTGVPAKWYVHVPDDTEPKGCGATVKIPGLGFGTDSHNKEEGHIKLTKGDNLIYEFTPEASGDYLFTCWMGSGCHSNYLHVTDDGNYSVAAPDDPTDIRIERSGTNVTVSFTPPAVPDGAEITGYKIIATDADGKRTKASGKESPVTLENLDANKTYTFQIITLATSGASKGENSTVLEAVTAPAEESPAETQPPQDTQPPETTQSADTTEAISQTTAVISTTSAAKTTAAATVTQAKAAQVIITEFDDLWKGNITVKVGVPVKWYVNVPEKADLSGCEATIKIPGLGWGTDTDNANENHLTLTAGKQLVYEFTPEKTGDILFTCLMGSGCHANYIHVIAESSTSAAGSGSTTVTTTTVKASSQKTEGPKTSGTNVGWLIPVFAGSLGVLFLTKKKFH